MALLTGVELAIAVLPVAALPIAVLLVPGLARQARLRTVRREIRIALFVLVGTIAEAALLALLTILLWPNVILL